MLITAMVTSSLDQFLQCIIFLHTMLQVACHLNPQPLPVYFSFTVHILFYIKRGLHFCRNLQLHNVFGYSNIFLHSLLCHLESIYRPLSPQVLLWRVCRGVMHIMSSCRPLRRECLNDRETDVYDVLVRDNCSVSQWSPSLT